MRWLFKVWFVLTFWSFAIYVPVYFLILNNATDSVQELTLPTLVQRGQFSRGYVDASQARGAVERFGIDPDRELADALADSSSVERYRIFRLADESAMPPGYLTQFNRLGYSPIAVDIEATNGVETRLVFATIQKRFTFPRSIVLAATELFVKVDGRYVQVNDLPKIAESERESPYDNDLFNINEYLPKLYEQSGDALAAVSEGLVKQVRFSISREYGSTASIDDLASRNMPQRGSAQQTQSPQEGARWAQVDRFTDTRAGRPKWKEGYGQGNLEYFIDRSGMRLHIGCPTPNGSARASSSIRLVELDSYREVSGFVIEVGDASFRGPFEADSRVGENNFLYLLEQLRNSDAVVSYDGDTVVFPKANVASVVPIYGEQEFSCNLM